MKKSTLALLTSVIAFAPLAAFAQDAQTSIQNNSNSGVAVGTGNVVLQDANQLSVQDQFDLGGYGYESPDAQTSIQVNKNEGAVIGDYNLIGQEANQTNAQKNETADIKYGPLHY